MKARRVILTLEVDTDWSLKDLKQYCNGALKEMWAMNTINIKQVQVNAIQPKKGEGR